MGGLLARFPHPINGGSHGQSVAEVGLHEPNHALSPRHVLIAVALTASCGTSSAATSRAARPSGEWPYPNGDLANDRVAPASVISSANISKLKEAWTLKLAGKGATNVDGAGSFAANPVVVNGVVYIQDLEANVYAVDLATGKLKWEYPSTSLS